MMKKQYVLKPEKQTDSGSGAGKRTITLFCTLVLAASLFAGCARGSSAPDTPFGNAAKTAQNGDWIYKTVNTDFKILETSELLNDADGSVKETLSPSDGMIFVNQTARSLNGDVIWAKTENGWVKIQDGQNSYLEEVVLTPTVAYVDKTWQVNEDLHLYEDPSANTRSLGKVFSGDTVTITNERSDSYGNVWGKTEQGWIYLETPAQIFVQEAKQEVKEPEEETAPEKEVVVEKEIVYVPVQPSAPAASSYSYLLPGADRRYLDFSEIASMSRSTLELARNELYARHGRMFHTDYIQAYFNQQPWYVPTTAPEAFNEGVFNEYEAYNLNMIVNHEINMGWR